MTAPEHSAGRRLSTITVDQAISSTSSLVVTVVAAHLLTVSSFGLFALVLLVYVFAVGMCRALVCEPLLVHPEDADERPGRVVGTMLGLSSLAAVLLFVAAGAALAWEPRLAGALALLATAMPLLAVQDLGRYVAFAVHRPGRALALDALWVGLLAVFLTVELLLEVRSLAWFVAAWAGSGAVSGLVAMGFVRGSAVTVSLGWLRETWDFSWRYLASYAASQGSALGAAVAVGGVAGARELAGVRGALLVTRPFSIVQVAAIAAGTAEVSRAGHDRAEISRHVRRTTGFTMAVATLSTLVIVFLPDAVGRLLLGATWAVTAPLLLPAGVQVFFGGLISGSRAALLGTRRIQTALRVDLVGVALLLLLSLVGAVLDGGVGAMWGVAAAQGLIAVVWWVVYLLEFHHGQDPPAGPQAAGSAAPVQERPPMSVDPVI